MDEQMGRQSEVQRHTPASALQRAYTVQVAALAARGQAHGIRVWSLRLTRGIPPPKKKTCTHAYHRDLNDLHLQV